MQTKTALLMICLILPVANSLTASARCGTGSDRVLPVTYITCHPVATAPGTAPSPSRAQTQQDTLNEALIAAAKKGDATAVRELLAKGAAVNARTNYGGTPLHFAADRGHLEVLKLLVEAGADINAKDDFYKMTPVMMALTHQRKEAVTYLQQVAIAQKNAAPASTANPPPVKPVDPALNEAILDAAKRGDLAVVKDLLAKGADVNAKTRYNQTPLMLASERGHVEVVKTLLDAKAELDVLDSFYKSVTALSAAAEKGHTEIVKLLLEKGAKGKENALMSAASGGHKEIVKYVLGLGGLSKATLDNALQRAQQSEIAEMLKQAGAKPPEAKQLKPEVQVEVALLQKYAGTYRLNEARQITFVVQNGKLGGWNMFQSSFALTAVDKNVFRLGDDDNRTITFNEENGKVVSITVYQNGLKENYNRVEGK